MRASSETISDLLLGARDMLPMAFAAATYGTAFGLVATQSGFSFLQSFTMSAMVRAQGWQQRWWPVRP